MLRILTLTTGLLLVAVLNDFFSISSWAQLPQRLTSLEDTENTDERLLAQADPGEKPAAENAISDESEKNLKKNPVYAAALLEKAREKLLSYSSIRTHITEKVEIGPKPFIMTGNYLQSKDQRQGKDLKLRLEFHVQSQNSDGKPVGSVLEICDGQVLWTEHTIKGTSRVTRRDVQAILQQAEINPQAQSNMLVAQLGLGGLPGLLASIQKNMNFVSVAERTISGKTLTVLNGVWKDEFLAQWKGGDPAAPVELPAYVPEVVRIYLDQDTLFPRRIAYLKKTQDSLQSMVTLNFSKVTLNSPIPDTEFTYEPPDGVFPVDVTKQYLQQLNKE
ncbi:LolA family protein [Gimesia sp.]|uniref:LolA family protein n=1 Tax=Gimesia sp. TaxID=2024833 RepID=UPI003A91672E